MTPGATDFLREGKYAAEVPVDSIEENVRKLDTVRLVLRRGDIAEASKYGRVFDGGKVTEPSQRRVG